MPNHPDLPQTIAKRFLESQRAQRDALNQQIAALQAQRRALDALIESLEQQPGLAPDEHSHTIGEPHRPYPEQPPEQPLQAIDAALVVLRAADGPLHFSVIARRALDARVWKSQAVKPEDSMKGALNDYLRKVGPAVMLHRVGPGLFALTPADPPADE